MSATNQAGQGHNPDAPRSYSGRCVGYVMDDVFLDHDTGRGHPESKARLESLYRFLKAYELRPRLLAIPVRPATAEEILLVHTPRLLQRIQQTADQPFMKLDPDTITSPRSYEVARRAAGAVLESLDRLFQGTCLRAFDFLRPPGHHAEPDQAMGFCLFNNVAIGAAYARRRYGLQRILVVDFDVHHGNGTQAAFYDTPEVLYVSTHQFPLYPGTGAYEETGRGDGAGYTLNFPLPAGTDDATYQAIFQEILEPVAEQYRPELILVSAGFDAYFDDPLANMRVTPQGFQAMTRSLLKIAEQHSGGKILFVLEGGYNLQGLVDSARAVLDEMLGEGEKTSLVWPLRAEGTALLRQAKQHVASFWKV